MKKIVLIIISALLAIALSFFLSKESTLATKTNDKIIEDGVEKKESKSSSSSTVLPTKEEKKSETLKLNDGRVDIKKQPNTSSSSAVKEPSKSEKIGSINLNDGRADVKMGDDVILKLDSQKEYKDKKSYEYKEFSAQDQGRKKDDELDISGGVDINHQQKSIDGVNFKMEKSF